MQANNRLLPQWFSRIESGQLRLPRFQRYEAWGSEEVASLLDALLRGLPVGAALILEVGEQEKFVSRLMSGAPAASDRASEQLLDGQQRLTAMWKALNNLYDDRTYLARLKGEVDADDDTPSVLGLARWRRENDERLFPVWVDEPVEALRRGYVPLRLLRPSAPHKEIIEWCNRATEDHAQRQAIQGQIYGLKERVATYNIPYLSLPARTPKDVALDVFIKLNTSSVKLTTYDVIVAELEEATGQSLHDLTNKVRQAAPGIDRYVAVEDFVLSVAALREDRPPTQASYQMLNYQRLVDGWERLSAGIKWTVETLDAERIFDAQRLPTVSVLPVLAALHEYTPQPFDAAGHLRALMRAYMWRAFFTRRYENSAATRALQDFRALREVLKGKRVRATVPIFDEESWPIATVDELVRARWPKTNDILGRAIMAVSIRAGALDVADGALATGETLRGREYHHLFPDALLTDAGQMEDGVGYKALNCALITWNTNRRISAKDPVTYLRERTEQTGLGEADIQQRLRSHLIPFDTLNVDSYRSIDDAGERAEKVRRDYAFFLCDRAARMRAAVVALCAGEEDVLDAWGRASV